MYWTWSTFSFSSDHRCLRTVVALTDFTKPQRGSYPLVIGAPEGLPWKELSSADRLTSSRCDSIQQCTSSGLDERLVPVRCVVSFCCGGVGGKKETQTCMDRGRKPTFYCLERHQAHFSSRPSE